MVLTEINVRNYILVFYGDPFKFLFD